MAKYDLLKDYLLNYEIPLTFKQIEGIIKDNLPRDAYDSRQWWGNTRNRRPQAVAWLDAKWRVNDVNLRQQKVIFKRG